ncbi:MAG: AAA family ATPase [Lachnospiraceae bacterium]|nr:AAA family ATPase [Lachnospiraceae bacterium]
MGVYIPLGIESFADMRENDYYYVDKTSFIKELLSNKFKVNLITRPRRFGKSLTMSMLDDFFDISKNSKSHFDGLAISRETEIYEKWMNQYPVVSISLKSIKGANYERAFSKLEVYISEVCKKYAFLEISDKADADDIILFKNLKAQTAKSENIETSLRLLTRMLAAHYGKKVILLIDEYDVPLAEAHNNGYYSQMLECIKSLLDVLKTNDYLEFGIVTGCLRISKESIFTGLNNLVVSSITTQRFDECIGFTEEEVEKLLADTGFADHAQEIREWYDGYRFGQVDVYCPWDVLNHVAALMENPKTEPKSYWGGTSHNNVVLQILENAQTNINAKFETLLSGETIHESVTEELTYDTMMQSEDGLWSLLFMTGYLTQGNKNETGGSEETNRTLALKIPNEEVKDIFRKTIVDRFKKEVEIIDRKDLIQAFWDGDAAKASELMSDILFNTISYYDYKESYYHAFAAGLMIGAGYIVESNYEKGLGRPDIVVMDRKKRRAILLEAKHAGDGETIEHACKEALKQIKEKRYAESLNGFRTVICYGIAFEGKDCLVQQLADK